MYGCTRDDGDVDVDVDVGVLQMEGNLCSVKSDVVACRKTGTTERKSSRAAVVKSRVLAGTTRELGGTVEATLSEAARVPHGGVDAWRT